MMVSIKQWGEAGIVMNRKLWFDIAVQISQKIDIVVVILLSFWTSFYEFRNQVYHYNVLS
jgi:hypothetical protein